jgi:uncharacterized membrane protein
VHGGPQTAFLEQSSGFYWWQEVHLLVTSLQENANDKTKKHKFGKKFAWAILSCLFIFQSVEVKISLQISYISCIRSHKTVFDHHDILRSNCDCLMSMNKADECNR